MRGMPDLTGVERDVLKFFFLLRFRRGWPLLTQERIISKILYKTLESPRMVYRD